MITKAQNSIEQRTSAKKLLSKMFKQKSLYIMLIVPMAIYILFNYVPMLKVYWAFTNYGEVAFSKISFVGLDNFKKLIGTTGFTRAFTNTLIISFYNIVFTFPVPIIIALMLNDIQSQWFKKTSQTIIYLPHFLSWVVIGSIWYMILAPQNSLNSQICGLLNIEPTYYFASNNHIRGLLVLTNIWQGAGYGAVVYLAALSSVDPGLYEAATMDGAGKWKQLIHISLPSIASTIVVMLILGLGKVLNIFSQIIVMCSPIVYSKADVIQTYAYRTGIEQMKIGYSMSVSVFKAVIGIILVITTDQLSKKIGQSGIF